MCVTGIRRCFVDEKEGIMWPDFNVYGRVRIVRWKGPNEANRVDVFSLPDAVGVRS